MLSTARFTEIATQIRTALERENENHRQRTLRILLSFKEELGKMSEDQIEELAQKYLKDQATRNQVIMVALIGKGQAPEHLVTQPGFIRGLPTPETWTRLPAESRRILSNLDATVMVKRRNTEIPVRVRQLTEEEVRKIISASEPERGILDPIEQNMPRNFVPEYAQFVGTEKDNQPDSIIVVFEYEKKGKFGSTPVIFKARMTTSNLQQILDRMTIPTQELTR